MINRVYDVKNVGRDNQSEAYQDVLGLEGEFSDASISESGDAYRVSRKGDELGQWFYLRADPRAAPPENNGVIAVCHGILPEKGLSKCSTSITLGNLFLQLSFSHANAHLADQFVEFIKSSFLKWKQ